jgi:hypothetical protein
MQKDIKRVIILPVIVYDYNVGSQQCGLNTIKAILMITRNQARSGSEVRSFIITMSKCEHLENE